MNSSWGLIQALGVLSLRRVDFNKPVNNLEEIKMDDKENVPVFGFDRDDSQVAGFNKGEWDKEKTGEEKNGEE